MGTSGGLRPPARGGVARRGAVLSIPWGDWGDFCTRSHVRARGGAGEKAPRSLCGSRARVSAALRVARRPRDAPPPRAPPRRLGRHPRARPGREKAPPERGFRQVARPGLEPGTPRFSSCATLRLKSGGFAGDSRRYWDFSRVRLLADFAAVPLRYGPRRSPWAFRSVGRTTRGARRSATSCAGPNAPPRRSGSRSGMRAAVAAFKSRLGIP